VALGFAVGLAQLRGHDKLVGRLAFELAGAN
jgi:hypothetical protein